MNTTKKIAVAVLASLGLAGIWYFRDPRQSYTDSAPLIRSMDQKAQNDLIISEEKK